jgi:hypothetical protein
MFSVLSAAGVLEIGGNGASFRGQAVAHQIHRESVGGIQFRNMDALLPNKHVNGV